MILPNHYVWLATLFASAGALLNGYYVSSMGGILEMEGFQITFSEVYRSHSLSNDSSYNRSFEKCSSENGASASIIIGLAVSISSVGSFIGALIGGWLSDQFSRKYTLVISGLVTVVGSILLASSFHIWTFILGRCINGIGVGLTYAVMPIYISEMSPKDSRGMLLSFIGTGFALGIFLAACTNIGFSQFLFGWRVAMIIEGCMGLVYAFGMKWMPHTSRWLIMKDREKEALLVLTRINDHPKQNCLAARNGTFVDTIVEFKDLKEAAGAATFEYKDVLRDIFKRKYITRVIPFVISGEVFPSRIRGLAVAISTGSFWIFTSIINQVIPLILESPIGVHGFFYIIAGKHLFSIFFVLFTLPETKGVSLEHMDALFAQSCLARVSLRQSSMNVAPNDKEDDYTNKQCRFINGVQWN